MALDPGETAAMRKVIEARLDVLRQEIADKLGDAAEVGAQLDRAGDAGDQSVADDRTTGDFADALRDQQEYQAGQEALTRIGAGGYGICIDCATDIPLARLRAQPTAARCIDCQQRFERGTGFHTTTM